MLTVIVIITGRYICSVNIYVVLTVIVTITGRYICVLTFSDNNSYCENNGEIYM